MKKSIRILGVMSICSAAFVLRGGTMSDQLMAGVQVVALAEDIQAGNLIEDLKKQLGEALKSFTDLRAKIVPKLAQLKAEKDRARQEALIIEISSQTGEPLYKSALFLNALNQKIIVVLLKALEAVPAAKAKMTLKSGKMMSEYIGQQTADLEGLTKLQTQLSSVFEELKKDLEACRATGGAVVEKKPALSLDVSDFDF